MAGHQHGFRFMKYDVGELRNCGAALCDRLQKSARYLDNVRVISKGDAGAGSWTKYVLNWFERSAADGLTTYSRYAHREFMFDLVHATWDKRPWVDAIGAPCKLRLVLESEWGKGNSPSSTTSMILDDAAKIAIVRADAKVMLFGSCRDGHRNEIAEVLTKLRRQTDDPAPWLWIDVPWRPRSNDRWAPAWGVLK
jgi:hypothetical protein